MRWYLALKKSAWTLIELGTMCSIWNRLFPHQNWGMPGGRSVPGSSFRCLLNPQNPSLLAACISWFKLTQLFLQRGIELCKFLWKLLPQSLYMQESFKFPPKEEVSLVGVTQWLLQFLQWPADQSGFGHSLCQFSYWFQRLNWFQRLKTQQEEQLQ